MQAPRTWKKFSRHPLSAEYADIAGEPWTAFVEDVRKHGILNKRKITLYEGKVLDGWQLQRACVEANVRPEYQNLPKGVTPEEFVRIVNDRRRHESNEQALCRAVLRRERVAAAREQGESIRTIAEKEGVSHKTIQNDLAGVDPIHLTEVRGRDEKTYPVRQPGDDTEAVKAAKKAAGNGKPLPTFDKKLFYSEWGALLRQIDKAGNVYRCKDTPQAAGLRRRLDEWKKDFESWLKTESKKKEPKA